ncbi:MAG TPA: polyribonucleotide nucleotidyltransferase, partial [Spirochaetia bacterium]|nr:polyribonucleotide nucleotidyltransferase [Spirochaetia bacterium]
MIHQVKLKIRDEELILETGRMAKQANGAVFARYGGSAVIATVCCSEKAVEGIDYVPLTVEYNEKYYAAGKIPGGYFKREARPRDKEILVSRLIDRPIRPLFSKDFGREIQLVPTTVATDQINPPDILGMIASYAAVFISDIPFEGPLAAVRMASLDGQLIVNPTFDQIQASELEIVVAGTEKGITMVEGGAGEISEDLMIKAIEEAQGVIQELCRIQHELRNLAGKPKLEVPEVDEELAVREELWKRAYPLVEEACFVKGKQTRSKALQGVQQNILREFEGRIPEEKASLAAKIFEELEYQIVRKSIVEKGLRTDGRKPEDIRTINCEVDILPRTHGAALFTRGETQALAITTLGTVYDEQIQDDIDGDTRRKRFMLHYNFPPFSVGETGRLSTGRREIGHGNLAERALARVLPSKEKFPYTIRLVSEVLESNGSSSMATVCGGTLSLLNAGVPIRKSVAGIAMGLIKEGDRFVVLSDILGEEDHLGDMDFKVTGTEDGITAFQMDIKIDGVDSEILRTALERARQGRLHILSVMKETLAEPRDSISDYAPKIITLKVDTDKIGAVIGPGGKTIKGISEKTGATINIDDDGTTTIYCRNKEKAEEAMKIIENLVVEPEVGKVYNGKVKRIMDFGAFVEFLPGKEGLCHISKLARDHINAVTDVLQEGQEIPVKII